MKFLFAVPEYALSGPSSTVKPFSNIVILASAPGGNGVLVLP